MTSPSVGTPAEIKAHGTIFTSYESPIVYYSHHDVGGKPHLDVAENLDGGRIVLTEVPKQASENEL